MINKPPPLNRDFIRDPNIKALKRMGFINHGSTLLRYGHCEKGVLWTSKAAFGLRFLAECDNAYSMSLFNRILDLLEKLFD